MTLHDVIDEYTPRARRILRKLPKQERRVLVALLRQHEPIRVRKLVSEARMEYRLTSVALTRLAARSGLVAHPSRGVWWFVDPWLAMTYRAWRHLPDDEVTAGIQDFEKLLAEAPSMLALAREETKAGIDVMLDEADEAAGRRTKLTEGEVYRIREEYAKGQATYRELAQTFDVSAATIARIIQRRAWKWQGEVRSGAQDEAAGDGGHGDQTP